MGEPNKDSEWFRGRCESGCQICGTKLYGKNNGLEWAHIVNNEAGGDNKEVNCLALCPNCAYVLDYVLKPAIYKALKEFTDSEVPDNWESSEGRVKL